MNNMYNIAKKPYTVELKYMGWNSIPLRQWFSVSLIMGGIPNGKDGGGKFTIPCKAEAIVEKNFMSTYMSQFHNREFGRISEQS